MADVLDGRGAVMTERSEVIIWLSGAGSRAERADRRRDRDSRSEVRS